MNLRDMMMAKMLAGGGGGNSDSWNDIFNNDIVVLSEAQKYTDEKIGSLTTDDIAPGTQVLVFDCGSATEVI